MVSDKADEVIEELSQLPFSRYQIQLETSMKSGDFIFNCVHLLYYKCHKIDFKWGGSYIDSPNLVKNKKATIKTINKKR